MNKKGRKLLSAYQSINNALGEKSNNTNCTKFSSFELEESCQQQANCKINGPQLSQLSDLTIETLSQINRLKKELPRPSRKNKKDKALMAQREEMLKLIETLEDSVPWVKSKFFNSITKDSLEYEEKVLDNPNFKDTLKYNFKMKIMTNIARSLKETRKQLDSEFFKLLKAADCINGIGSCDGANSTYILNELDLPDLNESDELSHNKSFNQCIINENKVADKEVENLKTAGMIS